MLIVYKCFLVNSSSFHFKILMRIKLALRKSRIFISVTFRARVEGCIYFGVVQFADYTFRSRKFCLGDLRCWFYRPFKVIP